MSRFCKSIIQNNTLIIPFSNKENLIACLTNVQEDLKYQDYTKPVIYNTLSPAIFELAASSVAHYLFPNNFAKYMLIKDDFNGQAAHFQEYDTKCDVQNLQGVENVCATAFLLGLEIRSYGCITIGVTNYLYIDDFAYSFYSIDNNTGGLEWKYRDHKVLSEEQGTLFPQSFNNTKCGQWLHTSCDQQKLSNAYSDILSKQQSFSEITEDIIFYNNFNNTEAGNLIKEIIEHNYNRILDFSNGVKLDVSVQAEDYY